MKVRADVLKAMRKTAVGVVAAGALAASAGCAGAPDTPVARPGGPAVQVQEIAGPFATPATGGPVEPEEPAVIEEPMEPEWAAACGRG